MATTYLSPGVYVEEVNSGIRPIQGVGTSTAAFIGITERASHRNDDGSVREPLINKATLVTTWRQFTILFGEFVPGAYLTDAVYAYFNNGGGPCYITSLRTTNEGDSSAVSASVTVPAAKGSAFSVSANIVGDIANGVEVIVEDRADKGLFNLSVAGEKREGLTMKKSEPNFVGNASFGMGTITDISGTSQPVSGTYLLAGGGISPLSAAEFVGRIEDRSGMAGLEVLDNVRLLVCPDMWIGYDGSAEAAKRIRAIQTAMVNHCEKMRYCFTLLDTPPGLSAQRAHEWRNEINIDSSYAALYYPWVEVSDLSPAPSTRRFVPPSGHMVGIYNRVDAERGVHKAPANEVLRGVIGIERQLTKGEQDVLNPSGVNCIREFAGRGIRIWGARTLSSDGAWRYIGVRRLFIYVEASMEAGLQWVVFEPNNIDLWERVSRDITSFLTQVWRSGALFGTTAEAAFYVKCDAELNTLDVRESGQLVIEAGICPTRPAEFVIFRISQWAGANAV